MSDTDGVDAQNDWALLPNLGAEEGRDWPRHAALPAVSNTTSLWRLLFPASHRMIGPGSAEPVAWPESLGERDPRAAFAWLDRRPGAHPWLGDAGAEEIVRRAGSLWTGPDPAVTRAVHDKAFAVETATDLGYEARALRDTTLVLDAEHCGDADAALTAIDVRLHAWPEWIEAFTLKPRLGGSGRGRVAGTRRDIDRSALRRALPRLADRGGALLEPWLERTVDLSVSMYVDPARKPADPATTGAEADAPVTLLGSLEQLVTPSGVPIGHFGEVDSRGRVFSGSRHEEATREAAVAVARAARDAGYFGPCGVDAFAFRLPDADDGDREVLRPVVELNARYTLGLVAIGLARRLLGRLKRDLTLAPGERRAFVFGLEAPAGHASWQAAADELGPGSLGADLGRPAPLDGPDSDTRGPGAGMLFAPDRRTLAPMLDVLGREHHRR